MQNKTTWEELVAQAHAALDTYKKPAAPSEPPKFVDINDLDPEELGYASDNPESSALEAEAERVYLGRLPLPKSLEWAAALPMDDFIEAYLACA